MICEQYPPEARTHVYTDGSATYVFQNGGAGISIYFSNGSKETANEATRRHYSNYKALMKVIALAVDSKPEEQHSCFSHRYAFSSASPDQQQIATFSKSSATTQQQRQSSHSVDTHPLRCFWK